MDAIGSSLSPVYKITYANGIVFYWTIWNENYRVPLIKYGNVFVPVNEHHTRVLLAAKVVSIAELRIAGDHRNANEVHHSTLGMIMGQEFSCKNELAWSVIVFGDPELNFAYYRDMARQELTTLLSEHLAETVWRTSHVARRLFYYRQEVDMKWYDRDMSSAHTWELLIAAFASFMIFQIVKELQSGVIVLKWSVLRKEEHPLRFRIFVTLQTLIVIFCFGLVGWMAG